MVNDEDAPSEKSYTPSQLERLAEQILDTPDTAGDGSGVPSEIAKVLLSESYRGTFPHPDVLRRLDDVIPGGAERAFRMTEIEQMHRHENDDRWLGAEIRYRDAETEAVRKNLTTNGS